MIRLNLNHLMFVLAFESFSTTGAGALDNSWMQNLSTISFLSFDHIPGGVLVVRKGESTKQYPHTARCVSTPQYQPEGFVITEGYPQAEASPTVQVLG